MKTEQPEALRLADELDTEFTQGRVSNHSGRKAAAELRRLHEVNQELLEALKLAEESIGSFVSDHGWSQRDMDIFDTVIAAIAKGEQT